MRPLVLVYITISVAVTIIFAADVDAQAGAYATGVLAMMTSAAFAVSLSAWRRGSRLGALAFGAITLILEVDVADPSEFEDVLEVRGVEVNGYRVLRAESSTVPNAIAAFLLHLRDTAGKETHCHFDWTQGNPIGYLLQYVLLGEGDTAPVTHEVLREAERDP